MLSKLRRKCRRVNRLLFLIALLWLVLFSALYINAPSINKFIWQSKGLEEDTAIDAAILDDFKAKRGHLPLATEKNINAAFTDKPTSFAVPRSPNEHELGPLRAVFSAKQDMAAKPSQPTTAVWQGSSKNDVNKPCHLVHAFYYPWYGNPSFDGKYLHWNHAQIPHWNAEIAQRYPTARHNPPDDIGSNFYPKLGAYSSKDPKVIESHLEQCQKAGIGVLSVSYYPPGQADQEGESWAKVFDLLFDKALKYGIKITFHIEPYKGRTEVTVKEDIIHIIDKYGKHPALFRYSYKKHNKKPLFYIYDSYHTSPSSWRKLLDENDPSSIRNTPYDFIAICLLVEQTHTNYITDGKFDGFYTYFATKDFTFGSSWQNWKLLSDFAEEQSCLFIPSIGPGYIDTRIRPWNSENTRERQQGTYYSNAWLSALKTKPEIVSITSFNEWHEGTQVEPAGEKSYDDFNYKNYAPKDPNFYLQLTNKFVHKFRKCRLWQFEKVAQN